jgi:hypothetical protein|tara:strand:- start:4338 stop:4877 length:540 start_codon:yes stop_codon:yes gene_type:complete
MDYENSALNYKRNKKNSALGDHDRINQFNNFVNSFSPTGGTDLTFREDEDGITLGAKGNVGLGFQHRDVNANVNAQFGLPDWAAIPTMMSDPNISANFLDRAKYQPETENDYLGADLNINKGNFNFDWHSVPRDIDTINARYNLGNNSSITASRRPLQNVTGLPIDEPAYMLEFIKNWK